jgi:aminoglycoside phosphotransferase
MNKILQLFDEEYVLAMFRRKLLPLYPDFSGIEKIVIKPYKRLVWTTTYHVVVGFDIYFSSPEGKTTKILVVCSAHSDEPRDNVFQAMKYLWERDFNQGDIDIPHPLFYSEYFRGTFYRGINGENLLYYIKEKNYKEVERLLPFAAELFARLHRLPAGTSANFNPMNSRIKTVIPGVDTILREMSLRYNQKFDEDLRKIYHYFISKEEKFFENQLELSLIHGDAHTENIIKTGENRIGLIDFTDFCLGDFARDIGTFLQQLEYKLVTKNKDQKMAEKLKKIFLSAYLSYSGLKLDSSLQERINLYYNFTAIRTSAFLFLKHDCDPKRAEELLYQVKANLKL